MSKSNSTRRSVVVRRLPGLLMTTIIAAQPEVLRKHPDVQNPGAAGETASLPVPAVSCRSRLFPTMSC